MFNLFSSKPKIDNETYEDSAYFFVYPYEDHDENGEIPQNDDFDYSMESLLKLDEKLEQLRVEELDVISLATLAFEAGSYLGEVLRKNSRVEYNWLPLKEAKKVCKYLEKSDKYPGMTGVLWSGGESICFPMGRIFKYMEQGKEASTYEFAASLINGPEGLDA